MYKYVRTDLKCENLKKCNRRAKGQFAHPTGVNCTYNACKDTVNGGNLAQLQKECHCDQTYHI